MSTEAHIHELLPWYLNGTLEPDLAEGFRRHLETCEDCRRETALLESLRDRLDAHGASFLDDHPSSEEIVAAARGGIDAATVERVRLHLALCASCTEEAGWVRGEGAYGTEPATPRSAATTRQAPLRWIAAIAAMLLLASIPLWRSDSDPAFTGVVTAHHLQQTPRGSDVPNVITLAEGQPSILMILHADLPDESFPFSLALVDETGREIRREAGVGAEALLDGYLHYSCTRTDCPPGKYSLRFYGSDADKAELELFFEVVAP